MSENVFMCLKCRKEVFNTFTITDATRINELGLSVRVTNLLVTNNIKTLGELLSKTANDLYRLRGFGSKCVNETRQTLDDFGKMLKDDYKNPEITRRLLRSYCGE